MGPWYDSTLVLYSVKFLIYTFTLHFSGDLRFKFHYAKYIPYLFSFHFHVWEKAVQNYKWDQLVKLFIIVKKIISASIKNCI